MSSQSVLFIVIIISIIHMELKVFKRVWNTMMKKRINLCPATWPCQELSPVWAKSLPSAQVILLDLSLWWLIFCLSRSDCIDSNNQKYWSIYYQYHLYSSARSISSSKSGCFFVAFFYKAYLSQLIRLWYLSHWRPAKAQASLRIRAVSPEPSLFAHMKYGSRRSVQLKIRHLTLLDGCACALQYRVYGRQKVP